MKAMYSACIARTTCFERDAITSFIGLINFVHENQSLLDYKFEHKK
jgi:hypothetical protein